MPWDNAARDQYNQVDNDMQCDVTDEEWDVIETFLTLRGEWEDRIKPPCERV